MILLQDLMEAESGIKNIITDRLDLGGLQVNGISARITTESTKKLYQSGKSGFK